LILGVSCGKASGKNHKKRSPKPRGNAQHFVNHDPQA